MGTDLMNEHLKKSLPIAKGALKSEKVEPHLNKKKQEYKDWLQNQTDAKDVVEELERRNTKLSSSM